VWAVFYVKVNRRFLCLYSDEAVAAFVETAGGSLKELSLNNVKKVNGFFPTMPPIHRSILSHT